MRRLPLTCSACARSLSLAAAVLAALGGCTMRQYVPGKVDTDAAAAAYAARQVIDPGLKQYMVSRGYPESAWPVPRWGLRELTLLGLYYHPDVRVARAQAEVARAQVEVAGQRLPITIGGVAEYDRSERIGDSPWSLGVGLEIPLTGESRREVIIQRADYLAQAAELDVGAAAWRVRSNVRARLQDLHAAKVRAESLRAEEEARGAVVALLERRLEAGYASAAEVSAMRVRLAEVEGQLAVARTDIERAFGGLAGALGLPLDTARAIELSFEELEALPEAPAPQDIQRDALLNRLDMRRRLLEYAAADSAVKLEVLRQYPTLTLRPGYLWDQGDSVWILGANLLLPPTLGNAPAIKQAEAQREAAAEVALQQQAAILAEGQAALATYRQSAIGYRSAQAASHMQLARSSQAQKQFDAGYVDRLDLSLSRLEMIVVDRNAYIARIEAERALGRLEDAVQRPLVGDPLPAFAAPVKQP